MKHYLMKFKAKYWEKNNIRKTQVKIVFYFFANKRCISKLPFFDKPL